MSEVQDAIRVNPGNDDERAVRELEDLRYDAVVAGDFDRFATYCHPELTYAHSNADVDSLESYLRKCSEGFYVYHRIDHPIDKVVIAGDTALVFGQMQADLSAAGSRKQLDNVSIAAWVRTVAGWKLLAYWPTVKPA
jgi:ketosteroid isomerase-like protein